MGGSELTVEILKEIRDEIRVLRVDTNVQFEGLRGGIQQLRADTNERFGVVESSLFDLTEQRQFLLRYARLRSERDAGIEARMSALESRVDKLESK
jgi:hypothetical protein